MGLGGHINLGSNGNSALTTYFVISSLSFPICEMGVIKWPFKVHPFGSEILIVNLIHSMWSRAVPTTKRMPFISASEEVQEGRPKEIFLFKCFYLNFLNGNSLSAERRPHP